MKLIAARFTFVLAFAALPAPNVMAASTELAKRYVNLMKYEDQYQEYRNNCLGMYQTVPVDKQFEETPERQNVIGPGTKYWPEVLEAYAKYTNEMCARPTLQEFLGAMADGYASLLTDQEMKDALNFYTSQSGRKLIEAHKKASKNVYQAWTRINGSYIPIATQRLHRAIEALYQRAHQEHR